ncbi:hypothetical protein MUK72_17795 (plasmid) [Halococcus dombrowskii]|nr:hypothetical protein [Halococcus dombrowskii]UOO97233.1 hypothetical protein MUK72_17795 [Halococcus dombrowskii]
MSIESEQPPSPAGPPLGIKVVCWSRILLMFAEFVLALVLFANLEDLYGVLLLVAIVVEIVIVYGLCTLTLWGWILAVIWYSIGGLQSASSLLSGSLSGFVGIILSFVTIGLVLTNYQSFR